MRDRRRFGSAPPPFTAFSQKVGDRLYGPGTVPGGGYYPIHRDTGNVAVGSVHAQTQMVMDNMSSMISASTGMRDKPLAAACHLRVYYTDAADGPTIAEVIRRNFEAQGIDLRSLPSLSALGVSFLTGGEGIRVMIECELETAPPGSAG